MGLESAQNAYSQLSGGRHVLGWLLSARKVLFLDDNHWAIPRPANQDVFQLLRKWGAIFDYSYMEEAQFCDRVAIIDHGSIKL